MRRYIAAPWLAALLALAGGAIGFVWKVHNLGHSCGYHEGGRLPNFPTKIALIVLVAVPVALTVGRAVGEGRSASRVVGLAGLAALLASASFGASQLIFFLSRHCYG
jgi:hypothetical protein